MKYSVVIPTYGRSQLLRQTLESLAHQDVNGFEVVVVCDGPDSQTEALSQQQYNEFPITWVFLDENRGQSTARNRGASTATGEILLFLDDDTPAASDWLGQHARYHEIPSAPELVVCGRTEELYTRSSWSVTEGLLRKDRARILAGKALSMRNAGDRFDLYAVCGLNCSIRRKTFLGAGGFDEALRYVSEDLELGTRLHHKGVRFIYEPLALVSHQSTKDLERYFAESTQHAGAASAYRVRVKRQRNMQTRPLTLMHQGHFSTRVKQRLAWQFPGLVNTIAIACRWMTELTNSEVFFQRWKNSTSATRYWQGVRADSLTLDKLRTLTGQPVPIFTFHSISVSDDPQARGWVRPERFRRFMKWLRFANYQFITPEEFLQESRQPNSVCLTFDDGYEDFYYEVFPHIESLKLKPTVFLVADHIGGVNQWDVAKGLRPSRLLSREQILEMHRHGVHFGSHSLTHPWLPSLSDADLIREVTDSKSRLEDMLGAPVLSFAYPFGGVDLRVRSAVAAAGYKVGLTVNHGLSFWQDPYTLNRNGLSERDTLLDFILMTATGRNRVRKIRYELFEMAHAVTMQLPLPLVKLIKRNARKLNITNPGKF